MNLSKIFSLCLFTTTLAFSACGGVEGDEHDQGIEEQGDSELETADEALRIGGGSVGGSGGTTVGWSTCNIRICKNKCVDTYPTGGGPLATCKSMCDIDACKVVF